MQRERRNLSHIGDKRRRDFDRSAKQLYALGLSPWAVEYFRRAARVSGALPHMVVCQVAMIAAGRMLSRSAQADFGREFANEPAPRDQDPAASTEPSYRTICARRNHVQSLWREIQRHESASSLPVALTDDGAALDPDGPARHARPFLPEPAGNGPAKANRSEEWNPGKADRSEERTRGNARSRRRGRAPSKHH
ncbi:MAG TPA: hypothetical protein VGA35_01520 [bacterium]